MAEPDFETIKQRAADTWGMGDYARIAELILPVSRALVDACFISAGQEVLDVAAGSGNLTVLAGEEGADVMATDISPGQVELGRARTAAEGLDVEWVVADAENLPVEDDRFDCAASVFGAMFAPRPEVVARELFRVVKPGGTVGMANWGPYGVQAEFFQLQNRYAPPMPDGVRWPTDWGLEEVVQDLLGPYASSLQMERQTVRFEFDSFEHAMQSFGSAGPSVAQREAMEPEQLQQMAAEARELFDRNAKAVDGRFLWDAEYLQVVARKRG
jgi:ubiquinone/menaquinone biosynthesis C-methylase UbiE